MIHTINILGQELIEKDCDLREINEALLPQETGAISDTDENDIDESALTANIPNRVYCDVNNADDLFETQERGDVATLALRNAQRNKPDEEEDENYDGENDDKKISACKLEAPTALGPSLTERDQLMEEDLAPSKKVGAGSSEPISDMESTQFCVDDTVAFSSFFTQREPKLCYRPNRRQHGFFPLQPLLPPPVERDEADRLDQEYSPTTINPAALIVALDAENANVRNIATANLGMTSVRTRDGLLGPHDSCENKESAKPFDPSAIDFCDNELKDLAYSTKFDMAEQYPWEEEIIWKGADENDSADLCYVSDIIGGLENPGTMKFSNVNLAKPSKDPIPDPEEDIDWEDEQESILNAGEASEALRQATKPITQHLKSNLTMQKPIYRTQSQRTQLSPNSRNSENGGELLQSRAEPVEIVEAAATYPTPMTVLAPNKDLEDGLWVNDILWDSQSEGDKETCLQSAGHQRLPYSTPQRRFPRLIFDMNDSNLTFKHIPNVPDEKKKQLAGVPSAKNPLPLNTADTNVLQKRTKTNIDDLLHSPGVGDPQFLASDRFNISLDMNYPSGTSNIVTDSHHSVPGRMQNSIPALKCLTTKNVLSSGELSSLRRPVLSIENLPQNMNIRPLRRKRMKGKLVERAYQFPKKKKELFCSEKDSYFVFLHEYALERQPCVHPIPGMVSLIVTYSRRGSEAEAIQARRNSDGISEVDTILLSPYEPTPLQAGHLETDGKPLSVIESHVYMAPCAQTAVSMTDFLIIRKGDKMYVREIDSVISVGVTEPRVEVMGPNSERYKKYSRHRALLVVLREFRRMNKDIQKRQRANYMEYHDLKPVSPTIDRSAILSFVRKKTTYRDRVFMKMLKEIFVYKNGRYSYAESTSKSLSDREAEILETVVTPTETAACEAMEAGLQNLRDRGIKDFTHPFDQGCNIPHATQLRLGAVGCYIKRNLLWSPWHRSQHLIQAQKQQNKELQQALSLAKIANELQTGAAVTESRLVSLSAAELKNLLLNQYRVLAKKIPTNIEERRIMVRQMAKGSHNSKDYESQIQSIIRRHRESGIAKSSASGVCNPSHMYGLFVSIPLEIQRGALEEVLVSAIPYGEENLGGAATASGLSANGRNAIYLRNPEELATFLAKGNETLTVGSSHMQEGCGHWDNFCSEFEMLYGRKYI